MELIILLKIKHEETPIMNGEHHQHITRFFQNYLILGYSNNSNILPNKPILEEIEDKMKLIVFGNINHFTILNGIHFHLMNQLNYNNL